MEFTKAFKKKLAQAKAAKKKYELAEAAMHAEAAKMFDTSDVHFLLELAAECSAASYKSGRRVYEYVERMKK